MRKTNDLNQPTTSSRKYTMKKFTATMLTAASLAGSAFAQGTQPMVAIHDSELTRALETMPASGSTPTGTGTTGFQWWTTDWHYFVMPESLQEALRSDGTAFTVIGDSNITAGLLLPNGAPKYPVVISLATEAMRDDEIAPLTNYVAAGGYLVVGGSSFTRTTNGTPRGDFALANQMGIHMFTAGLTNWANNSTLTRRAEHRIISHLPDGPLTWRMPSYSEETSWGISPDHNFLAPHDIWAINAADATVIATGDSHPYLTVKPYGKGYFIYDAAFQPLIGHGGFAPGMYAYGILRKSIEWAFENSRLPVPKLSPWPYQYDAAFMIRHDLEDFANEIADINLSAGFEFTNGVKGDYYFCTGTLRQDMSGSYDTNAVVTSIRNAVSAFGATVGPHNGGLKNPDNAALAETDYDFWHWGLDEALDVTPAGYASGKAYATASLSNSFNDIESWLSGLESSSMRTWVAPNFNATRENSYDIQSQLGVKIAGDQKLTPFPHWTVSTQTSGKRYSFLSEPVSDWFVGGLVAQSLEPWHPPGVHNSATLHAAVDYYYNLGALVNVYSHTLSTGEGAAGQLTPDYITYSMNTNLHPRLWSANGVGVYNWWLSRSNAQVTVTTTNTADVSKTTFSIHGSTATNEAVELDLPNTSLISAITVLTNGKAATGTSWRTNGTVIRVLVGTTVTNVVISYTQPPFAGNDFYSVAENTLLSVAAPGVLGNDITGANAGTLTPILVSGPLHGTLVTGNTDGSFSYLPATNFTGIDVITYAVTDGFTTSKVASVTINVLAPGQLFADNFARSNTPVTIAPWSAQTGTWGITNNTLSGGSDANSYANAWVNNTNWTDYTVSAQVQFSSTLGFGGGIGGRLNPTNGAHYAAWVYPDASAGGGLVLKLIKFEGWQSWSFTPMATATIPSVGTNSHTVAMTFAGANISVSYDGAALINTTDNNYDLVPAYTNGGITADFYTDTNGYAFTVDNVVVSTQVVIPPVTANADSYSTTSGTALNVAAPGVLSNDTGGSNTLTASLVSTVSHGTLSLNANGSFIYTPATNFSGADSFTYKATDGGSSSTATVSLTVNSSGPLFSDNFTSSADPGPLAPWIAQDGTWTVTGGRLLGTSPANAYGNAYVTNSSWTDYTVTAQVAMSSTSGYGGGIGGRLNPTTGAHYAAWIYPENSAGGGKVMKLVKFEGWNTWSFTPMATANLTSVGTNYHTIALTFQGANISVTYDGTPEISVTDNGFDSVAAYTGGGITADLYTASTAYGMSVDNVTVTTLAAAPVVANNDSFVTVSGTALIEPAPGVLANDTGGSGALTASLVSNVTHGALALGANGSFTYTPANGFSGPDSFTYKATDGTTTSTATVALTVNAAGLLFSDDFTSSADPGPLTPWVAQDGTWSVTGGRLLGQSGANSYGNAYVTNSTWTDYSVQAQVAMSATTGWGGGIGGRLNPATGAHYAAWVYPDSSAGGGNVMKLVKFEGWNTWSFTPMATATLSAVGTNYHTVAMTFQGATIAVSFDGTQVINVTDNNFDSVAPFTSGGITADLYTDTSAYGVSVDNVIVSTLAPSTPSIITQPVSRTNIAGTTATFTVAASGSSLSYQWFKSTTAISGATTATLTLANVADANAGSYSVTVTNTAGSASSSAATLTVIDPIVITTQPASSTNAAGTTATFSVIATGTSPVYQWKLNGTSISGATASTYSKANVSATDAGSYTVTITNLASSVTSTAAVLTVSAPPVITTGPVSQTIIAAQTATFTVAASGSAPLSYQWKLNGNTISGATASSYAIANAQPTNNGSYTVTVTNLYGSTTSTAATLTVNYSLTTSATTGGTVTVNPSQASYAPNAVVSVTATPAAGYVFTGWTGSATGSNSPLSVTMTTNKTITANFAQNVAPIVIDNISASFIGTWGTGTASNDNSTNYRYATAPLFGTTATATFTPSITKAGKYDVYVWYPTDSAAAANTPILVAYSGGTTSVTVNQTANTGTWVLIASGKTFAVGTSGFVRISNNATSGKRVLADSVQFVYSTGQ